MKIVHRITRPSLQNVLCPNCSCVFYPRYDGKGKYQKYCSQSCSVRAQHKRGEIGFENKNPNYIDGRSSKIPICKCGKPTKCYRSKLCQNCHIQKIIHLNKTRIRHYTEEYRQKFRERMGIGETHRSWKGDNVGYKGIHQWLNKTYGKAIKCENKKCKGTCKWFEYCLIRGRKHKRKRGNYKILCRKCHRKYDASRHKTNT